LSPAQQQPSPVVQKPCVGIYRRAPPAGKLAVTTRKRLVRRRCSLSFNLLARCAAAESAQDPYLRRRRGRRIAYAEGNSRSLRWQCRPIRIFQQDQRAYGRWLILARARLGDVYRAGGVLYEAPRPSLGPIISGPAWPGGPWARCGDAGDPKTRR